jgi:hypothetical protein
VKIIGVDVGDWVGTVLRIVSVGEMMVVIIGRRRR